MTSVADLTPAARRTDPRLTAWQPADDWSILAGLEVEVHRRGQIVDVGVVDCVTDDGNILWLRQNGALQRRIVEKTLDVLIRPCSPPWS